MLGDSVGFYKVGLQLIFAGGIDFAERLGRSGKRIFLDAKLLDIDNTVAGAVESIAALGDDVPHHPRLSQGDARRGRGARARAAEAPRRDRSHLHGRRRPGGGGLCRHALRRWSSVARPTPAPPAWTGSSPRRRRPRPSAASSGPTWLIVTPGIRPAGAGADDQKRVATPGVGDSRRGRLSRRRPADHRGAPSPRRRRGDRQTEIARALSAEAGS